MTDTTQLVEALELALEYWRDRQQRYKNRKPRWVADAESALAAHRKQKPSPDITQLVEALETALLGTPLDDVPNRDNDDIWHLCYPHLPERAADALRDHLNRIETALAAHQPKEITP